MPVKKDSLLALVAINRHDFQGDVSSYWLRNVLQIFFLILHHTFRWEESQAPSDRCQGARCPAHLPATWASGRRAPGTHPSEGKEFRAEPETWGHGEGGGGSGRREMPQRGKWSGNQLSPSHTLLLEKGLVFIQQTLPSGVQVLMLSWLFLTMHIHYFRKRHIHTPPHFGKLQPSQVLYPCSSLYLIIFWNPC